MGTEYRTLHKWDQSIQAILCNLLYSSSSHSKSKSTNIQYSTCLSPIHPFPKEQFSTQFGTYCLPYPRKKMERRGDPTTSWWNSKMTKRKKTDTKGGIVMKTRLWLFSMRLEVNAQESAYQLSGFRNVSNYSSRMPMERINWSKMHDLISSERNASLRQHSDNSTSLKTPETLTVLNDSELSCFSHAHSRCLTMPPAWAPRMTMLILLL